MKRWIEEWLELKVNFLEYFMMICCWNCQHYLFLFWNRWRYCETNIFSLLTIGHWNKSRNSQGSNFMSKLYHPAEHDEWELPNVALKSFLSRNCCLLQWVALCRNSTISNSVHNLYRSQFHVMVNHYICRSTN